MSEAQREMGKAQEAAKATTLAVRVDPQELIKLAIEHGSSVDTLERLVALQKDVMAVQAKAEFDQAMTQFQRRCPKIKKNKSANIVTRSGSFSYQYADLGEIADTIKPLLGELGLAVTFRVRSSGKSVSACCKVTHTAGHCEESGEIEMPIPEGGPNPAQAVGIANTYAKRYALQAALGIVPEDDTDAETGAAPKQKKQGKRETETVESAADVHPELEPDSTHADQDAGIASQEKAEKPSAEETVLECQVLKVRAKRSKAGSTYLMLDTDAGTLYAFHTHTHEILKGSEGQRIRVELEAGGLYRQIKEAFLIPPAGTGPVTDADVTF